MIADLKVIPHILLYWPISSGADVGGMAAEIETSCQYSVRFCCHVTAGSRGTVWQNGVWHESVYECHWILQWRKYCTYQHSQQCLLNICGDKTLHWMWAKWGGGWVVCNMQALVYCWWKCTANGGDCSKVVFCSWLTYVGVSEKKIDFSYLFPWKLQ